MGQKMSVFGTTVAANKECNNITTPTEIISTLKQKRKEGAVTTTVAVMNEDVDNNDDDLDPSSSSFLVETVEEEEEERVVFDDAQPLFPIQYDNIDESAPMMHTD